MAPRHAATIRKRGALFLALAAALAAPAAIAAREDRTSDQPVDERTWTDHDGRPIPSPAERDPGLYGHLFREAVVEQLGQVFDVPDKVIWVLGAFGVPKNQPAANVNAFDEVPNSTWFTNRNHVRALASGDVRRGAFGGVKPTPPYTIKSVKKHGYNPGFNIKDAAGKRWVVKLDAVGFPQLSSGAGVVSSRLVWAAGYNISHDEAFTFRREELTLDPDVVKGKEGEAPFPESKLDQLLERGARGADGRYYAGASLFLPGSPIGPLSFRGKRRDDPNDWFHHKNRRELRGLYIVYGWLNNWDVKDNQSLDTFGAPEGDSLGYVTHYLLDVNGSLGASARGPKPIYYGYEQTVDFGWTLKRLVTLGFAVEPWRRARQKTGIPSVGNFESDVYEPDEWRPSQYVEPFRQMTNADGYWGAKLVASISDAQIAAAIDAAGYDDPRARSYLANTLIERRDKVARYWFDRVAPLDFFHVSDGVLQFHDLAVDRGLVKPRGYRLEVRREDGTVAAPEAPLAGHQIRLRDLARDASGVTLTISVAGSRAKAVRVDLKRKGSDWIVARVRHG